MKNILKTKTLFLSLTAFAFFALNLQAEEQIRIVGSSTVFPFILRGNHLIGIDSANCLIERRKIVWERFSKDWKLYGLDKICKTVDLDGVIPEIAKILKGKQTGRILLEL